MEIITAGDGTAHVSSADDGAIYAGIMGQECYVTGIGDKLSCTMQSANKALVGTGVGCMYGRMLRVTTPEEVTIESGTQNQRRNDIICARFTTSAEGSESGGLVVLKGTSTSDLEAEDPEIPGGDILEGATEAYMPLWRIPIDGINAGEPEPLFSVLLPMAELQTGLGELRDSVSQRGRVLWEGTWKSGQITVGGLSSYTLFLVVVSNGDSSPGSDETMVGYVGQGSDSGRFYAQANSVWETDRASATAVASLRCSVDRDVLSNPIFSRINASTDFTYLFQGVRKIVGIV